MSRSQCQQIVPEQELPEGGGEGNGEVPNGHHGHGCDQDPARAQAIRQMAARGLQSRVADKDAGSQKIRRAFG